MAKKKVLIVEDDELNMKLFSDLLALKGIDIIPLYDSANVLDTLQANKPDLILMDIQLHGEVSGLDLIRQIKSNTMTSNIPIIAITGFAMKKDEIRILQSGCEAYLPKPVGIDNFFTIINKYVKFQRG